MNQRLWQAGSICLAGLLTIQSASATTYNIRNVEHYKNWSSAELYLGEERTFRAITSGPEGRVMLTFDFHLNNCNSPSLSTFSEAEQSSHMDIREVFYQYSARVDRGDFYNGIAEATMERGETTLYLYYSVINIMKFVEDVKEGRMLRFKITEEQGSEAIAYLEFSLSGSKAALIRAQSLCRKASKGPESYF